MDMELIISFSIGVLMDIRMGVDMDLSVGMGMERVLLDTV